MDKKALGKEGELIALAYLRAQGYRLLEQNYRAGHGEIDIILMQTPLLVFVEVKTRSNRSHGYPEEAVSREQIAVIGKTAQHYIETTDWQGDIRFDILSIELEAPYSISHFEDAFTP